MDERIDPQIAVELEEDMMVQKVVGELRVAATEAGRSPGDAMLLRVAANTIYHQHTSNAVLRGHLRKHGRQLGWLSFAWVLIAIYQLWRLAEDI